MQQFTKYALETFANINEFFINFIDFINETFSVDLELIELELYDWILFPNINFNLDIDVVNPQRFICKNDLKKLTADDFLEEIEQVEKDH